MTKFLNFEIFGNKNPSTPIVICHGLLGNLKNWYSVANSLEKLNKKVVLLDMRNHGNSFWNESHTYENLANDILNTVSIFDEKINLVGHSMGGKAAMYFACKHGNLLNKLVVVDIAPSKYKVKWNDLFKNLFLCDYQKILKRTDFEKYLHLKGYEKEICLFLSQNLIKNNDGYYKLKFNLKAIHKNLKKISSFPKILDCFYGRTLFIKGEKSNYIKDDNLKEILKLFPNYKLEVIHNAGHWVHFDKRIAFQERLLNFLES